MQTKQSRRLIKKEDRISSLPDCLRVDIVSRFPSTTEAIRTGILSKRWQNLWTEVHNLFFIHHSVERIPEFFSYIEKVLRQRGHLELNKFQLDISYDGGIDKQVNNLIRYAFSCNVIDFDLVLVSPHDPYQSEFVLDQYFFVNSSITHMHLDGCIIKPVGAISWTNLKSLCIGWGNLDENLIKNILSGSPLLETLKLQYCEGFLEIDITSKSVKNLVFSGYTDMMECHVPLVVKINAPHILSLTIEEDLKLGKVVLLNVSSLVEAKLNYYYESDEPKSEDESDEPASEDESDEPASGDESDEPTSEDESDEPTSDDESDFPTSWKKREKILKGLILSLRHVKNLKIGSHCQETLARLEAKGFTFPLNNDGSHNGSAESED